VRVIEHRHRAAAVAADRVYYSPHIKVLEPDHPERRFVAALCRYSHAVDTGHAGATVYDQEEAERFARALLMPAAAFAPVAGRSDTELAALFAAPLDQVAIRRREAGSEDAAAAP
jgi:IrrE N-terminal-like domain